MVRNAEDKAGGIGNDIHDIGNGDDVLGKAEALKIRAVKERAVAYRKIKDI